MSDLAPPLVSFIVVNYNGQACLPDCLSSLAALDGPGEAREVILVDNASTDDSVALAQRWLPGVRVISQTHNSGFAPACNCGARAARGDYLAFVNNDARLAPDWLTAMLAPFHAEGAAANLACVASTLVSWDGKRIDFVGGALTAYGWALQTDQGLPYDPDHYREARELLFACGGAMLIRREVFQEVGGFDDDFVAYFEDVDLGWRLWLAGYQVRLAPRAVAYHRLHATGARLDTHRRFAISELNALRMVVKNFDDENMFRVLTAALLAGAQKAALHGSLRTVDFEFPGPMDQAPRGQRDRLLSPVAASYVAAAKQLADELPKWLTKRVAVQRIRRCTDAELFAKFPLAPTHAMIPWRRSALTHQANLKALEVPVYLQPKPDSHLLIISHETIGPQMAGPGMRCLEMARALSRHSRVTLAVPGPLELNEPGLALVGYQSSLELEPAINAAGVVLAVGQLCSRLPRLRALDRPLIVDWYDPFEIEKLALTDTVLPEHRELVERESHLDVNLQARAGDFYLCASERQRDMWLGVLLACGRLNLKAYSDDPTMRSLIDVVPFGLSSTPPRRSGPAVKGVVPGIRASDRVLYWGGGLWQWFDPFTLLDAMATIAAQRDDVKVFFAAGLHFDQAHVPEMPVYGQVLERARGLGLLDRTVFFGDWVPYADRQNYLLEADLGISLHRDGLESHFAFRTRLLDYFWAGLPMVVTRGDSLADLVEQHHLGRVVPPGDASALAAAILELLAGEARAESASRFAAVAAEFTWEKVVQPVARFLEAPRHAPDARQALDQLELAVRVKSLEETLTTIQQGKVMRFLRQIDRWRGIA